MVIESSTVTLIVGLISAAATLGGVAFAIIKWVIAQNKQSEDIAALKKQHNEDMEVFRGQEAEKNSAIQDELCVISYALLAALDGLKQLHCNGEVTKAHEKLEKHLNKQAHGQK